MQIVILVIHILVAAALIGVVLMQRSEGGALGIGGSTAGGLMTSRGAANLLTRATAVLATVFFLTSLGLALLAERDSGPAPLLQPAPAPTQPAAPSQGGSPAVPLSQ